MDLHFGWIKMVSYHQGKFIIELPGEVMYAIMGRSIRWHQQAACNHVRKLDYKDILYLRREHNVDLPYDAPVYFQMK